MGLFDRFKMGKDHQGQGPEVDDLPEVPLVEKTSALPENGRSVLPNQQVGLAAIYSFLQSDFETRGYNDALINPDESYKADNFDLISYDLQILLHQVSTYHDDLLRELDFHIQSRSRAGLIDLVEELKNRKEMVLEHVQKVQDIKNDLEQGIGMSKRILLSYQRGFMKGLAAITQSNILNKQF